MTWTDHYGGSIRHDGAKVGEFCIEGRYEWWGYPADYRYGRTNPELVQGPFESRELAKNAMDTAIPFPTEIAS